MSVPVVSDLGSLLRVLAARRGTALPGGLAPVDPEAIAGILYTSGTTGQPKGVMRVPESALRQHFALTCRLLTVDSIILGSGSAEE